MKRDQMRELLEAAAGKRLTSGLAAWEHTLALCWGAICEVKDQGIHFPEERLPYAGKRTWHDGRRVIVVTATLVCRDDSSRILSVVPCTSSHRGPLSASDFLIPADQDGFSRTPVVALAELVQPILKSDILTVHGILAPDSAGILARILANRMGTSGP